MRKPQTRQEKTNQKENRTMADKKLKVADTTYCDDALKKWDESLPPNPNALHIT